MASYPIQCELVPVKCYQSHASSHPVSLYLSSLSTLVIGQCITTISYIKDLILLMNLGLKSEPHQVLVNSWSKHHFPFLIASRSLQNSFCLPPTRRPSHRTEVASEFSKAFLGVIFCSLNLSGLCYLTLSRFSSSSSIFFPQV